MVVCNLNCPSCPFAYICIPMIVGAFIALKRYNGRLQKRRIVSQLSFLFITNTAFVFGSTGLIYTYFYCWESPFALMACPIGVLEHAFADRTWYILIYLVGAIGFASVIFGRAACGWACPIGFLQDLTKGRKIKRETDKKMRYLKYAILALIPPACYITERLAYTEICPIGGLTATIPHLIINPYGYTFTKFFLPKMIITAGFFVLIFLMTRGWCRHLCPVGAMMAPFNKISFLQLNYYEEKCIKCFKCAKICPMQIEMPYKNKSTECIRCGKCVDTCPTDALDINFKWQ
ncbi:MAG TPA: 4Fe-4S binding protein [Thermoplasmata archaeon]|nr:4Fe-4S binding protein [Thermoplasmata archaeon]